MKASLGLQMAFSVFFIYLLVSEHFKLFYLLSQQTCVNCSFAFS